MGAVKEVQEQIKADMEAMKEQMATVMGAMMSMKKIMEVIAAAVAVISAIIEVDPTPPIWPQSNKLSDLGCERQRVGKYRRPPLCANSKQVCLPAIWLASQLYTTQCGVHSQ